MSLLYPVPTPTVVPSPTPEPIKELRVCLGSEPRSLYVYEAASSAEQLVQQALTDGPIDVLSNGEKHAILFKDIPSVDSGSVVYVPTEVFKGDLVVNSSGNLIALEAGVEVFPSGCTSPDCALVWDGASPLQLDQLVANFTLKEGLKWSDGEALAAEDFVFSFDVAADPVTPTNKRYVDLTADYLALDSKTIEWTAMPGLVTDAFENFLWLPLPSHVWGNTSAQDLLEDETANRMPLSYGPFMVDDWQIGQYIHLVKNPNYHRADEGLPAADILTFKFLSAADGASLLTAAQAECDFVSSAAIDAQNSQYLRENAGDFGMRVVEQAPDAVEMLAFGIAPASYDDNYYPYGSDRPDFFGDVRTRQAVASCIDQQTITEKLLGGSVMLANGLLPPDHALLDGILQTASSYDPAAGIALLQQVGWQDADLNPETPLTAFSNTNIPFGTAFEIELLTSSSPLRAEIAAEIAANLSACGIKANITQLPLAELYQPAPQGPLFGRNFDLALISLQIGNGFDCRWFSSQEIPTESNYWLGATTGGANFFGYANEAYDTACGLAQRAGLDQSQQTSALQSALSRLNDDLPVIPIYYHQRAVLIRDDICGLPDDLSSEYDLLSMIEKFFIEDGC